MSQTPASFCLFLFISHFISFNRKFVDFSGIRNRIVRVEGEHAIHLTTPPRHILVFFIPRSQAHRMFGQSCFPDVDSIVVSLFALYIVSLNPVPASENRMCSQHLPFCQTISVVRIGRAKQFLLLTFMHCLYFLSLHKCNSSLFGQIRVFISFY